MIIDATWMGLIKPPEIPWSCRATSCSIKYTIAVWATRRGYKLVDGRWAR